MSSKSRQAPNDDKGNSKEAETDTSRLPFEPSQNRKKAAKKESQSPAAKPKVAKPQDQPKASVSQSNKPKAGTAKAKSSQTNASASGIPEVVSKRMVRRIALFSGIPTALGMTTFLVSYLIVTKGLVKLPTVAVLFLSLGFFGLGVLGLSYGALSASWDEDRLGGWLGWNEFKVNFQRTRESWRSNRQKTS